MSNTRKNFITKQDLIDNKVRVEVIDDKVVIYQDYIQTSKKDYSCLWSTERTQHISVDKHSYGDDYVKVLAHIKIEGKMITLPVSNIVWIYYNDIIPAGYEVDHIDENTLDNRIENLQLLTPKENIRKRKFSGANQYINSKNCDNLEDFIMKKQEIKDRKKEYDAKIAFVKANMNKYQKLLNEAKEEWHDLVKERDAIA